MQTDSVALLQSGRKLFLRGLVYAGIVSFFLNFATLVGSIFMIQVYERVLPARSYDTLWGLAIIGALGVLVYGLLDFVRNWTFSIIGHGLAQKLNLPVLQAGVMRSIQGGVTEGGAAIKDINELRTFLSGSALATPLDGIWSLVFLTALYLIHPVYAAVAVGFILVMVTLNFVMDMLTRNALKAAREAEYRHAQDVANSLRHAEAIESMGMLPALVRDWRQSQDEMLEFTRTANVRLRIVMAITKSVQKSQQMVIVATGALLVLSNSISPSVLFAGMVLSSQAVAPFAGLVENWRNWVSAIGAWKRIKTLVTDKTFVRQSMPAPVGDGDLVVENLYYMPEGRETPVLRGISFSLSPGEVLGIAGASGAGKSTLARCLTGIIKPSVGGVYLDGNSTYLWERGSFGKAVGYLPQSLSLIDGTVRQTISRMQDGDPRDVIRAAQMAGIHELIGRLPFGYDTPIREGMHLLSGGQKQRLALARALYGDPKLIILDEPNSNLDHTGELALVEAVRQARARGAIVIMIAHRPSVMSVADKMMVIEDGTVSQFGPRTQVIESISPEARVVERRRKARTIAEVKN